jgi:hypothetical protein
VLELLAELALAPGLVGAATVAGDRWGQGIAGLISGLPVVVGPLLLIAAHERGLRFAASSANGVLLGLPALGGFALAYARSATRGPGVGLLSGWASASALAAFVLLCPIPLPFPAGLVVAAISLSAAFLLMPRTPIDAPGHARSSSTAVSLRMGATVALVLGLWTALAVLGPTVGGILAALPTVVSVLVFFAHRGGGADAAVSLLRGALAGMASFVAFCAVVAWLLGGEGPMTTFLVGTVLSVGVQAVSQRWLTRWSRTAPRRIPVRAV